MIIPLPWHGEATHKSTIIHVLRFSHFHLLRQAGGPTFKTFQCRKESDFSSSSFNVFISAGRSIPCRHAPWQRTMATHHDNAQWIWTATGFFLLVESPRSPFSLPRLPFQPPPHPRLQRILFLSLYRTFVRHLQRLN